MKAILLSCRSEPSYQIIMGYKTYEVRKTAIPSGTVIYNYITKAKPTIMWYMGNDDEPFDKFDLIIDKTAKRDGDDLNGTIPFKYSIGRVIEVDSTKGNPNLYIKACLSDTQVAEYGKGKPLYFHEITQLEVLDKPMQLEQFGVKKAPQSYRWVEVANGQ